MYELSFEEVAKKYPDFPRTIMRKIDTALRGIIFTEKALERAKEEGAFYDASADFACLPTRQSEKSPLPVVAEPLPVVAEPLPVVGGVFFRDGTYVLGLESVTRGFHSPSATLVRSGEPYLLDLVNGKLWLLDGEPRPFRQNNMADAEKLSCYSLSTQRKRRGEPVEEVYFAPVPRYFGKKTSRGTPMIKMISSRAPNRISINISSGYCHFFKEKLPCKYCNVIPWSIEKGLPTLLNLEDLYETVNEALGEEGGFTSIHLTGGSDPRGNAPPLLRFAKQSGGDKPYENEVNEYIKVLKTLERCFGREKIPAVNRNGSLPVQAIASAFPKKQLIRLKEAGLTAYRSNLEVWDEKLFQRICPGKAKYFGRQYWIESILQAVEIFGRGNVSTQLVAGAELAKPYGFKTIDEAIASDLECAEFFARHGIYTTFCILWVDRGSVFYREKQELPPLEYFVRLAKGVNEIRRKYKLSSDFNDYRRDGFHPDMDLARLAP